MLVTYAARLSSSGSKKVYRTNLAPRSLVLKRHQLIIATTLHPQILQQSSYVSVLHFSVVEEAIQGGIYEKVLADDGENFSKSASMENLFRGFRIITCGFELLASLVSYCLGQTYP